MRAQLSWHSDILVVDLNGTIDFENVIEFRRKSLRHFTQNKVIFSLRGLNFVGSTGIKDFVSTINDVSNKNPFGLGIVEAGPEYRRLLEPLCGHSLVLFHDLATAKQFFSLGHLEFQEKQQSPSADKSSAQSLEAPPIGVSEIKFS